MNDSLRDNIEKLTRRILRNRLIQKLVRDAIIHIPDTYSPFQPRSLSYVLMKQSPASQERCPQGLPVPPESLRLGYGGFLNEGKKDVATMRAALEAAGHPLMEGQRVLELGCASGRMLRWLYDLSDRCEIWGADIMTDCVVWCEQNLSPPFHFVTTSTAPHLPFEDRYFNLIYAGSVFTHIDDMAQTWFLELRRVLKPGAILYVTIHDKHTIKLLQEPRRSSESLARYLRESKEVSDWANSDFDKFTIGRATYSQVFYDLSYLTKTLTPFFKLLSVEEEAYGSQTALILERQ